MKTTDELYEELRALREEMKDIRQSSSYKRMPREFGILLTLMILFESLILIMLLPINMEGAMLVMLEYIIVVIYLFYCLQKRHASLPVGRRILKIKRAQKARWAEIRAIKKGKH